MKIYNIEPGAEGLHPMRVGKPTASAFKKLITSTGKPSTSLAGYALELAGEAYSGQSVESWGGSDDTEYGKEMEATADAYYQFNYAETTAAAFVTDDDLRWGCTPDRFVGEDGLTEYKNFPKTHLAVLLKYSTDGKIPSGEIAQVQGQLLITERKWCDLLYFSPLYPKLVIRVYPDLAFMATLTRQMKECIALRDEIVAKLRAFDE